MLAVTAALGGTAGAEAEGAIGGVLGFNVADPFTVPIVRS